MKIKKSLAAICASAVLACPAFALDIGDKMPEPQGNIANVRQISETAFMTYFVDESGNNTHNQVYLVCGAIAKEKPFGIYNFETGIVYIDKNMDGDIDAAHMGTERHVSQDTPDCATGI